MIVATQTVERLVVVHTWSELKPYCVPNESTVVLAPELT